MNRRGFVSAIFGLAIVALGVLVLLHTLGIATLSITGLFMTYWPVLLILAGIALLMKRSILGTVVIGVLIVLAGYAFLTPLLADTGIERTVIKQVDLTDVDEVSLQLNYGAGDMTLEAGGTSYLLRNTVTTTHTSDPEITSSRDGNNAIVTMSRSSGFEFWSGIKEEWAIELNPGKTFNIDADYGAADVMFDLRGLQVDSMDIDSGAASTEIVFEKYPTEVKIGAGASSFALYFPFGYQVKLEIDGGAISKDLNGFVKIDDFYFSQGYEEGSDSITVSIDAGAVSIDAGFYTAEGIQ